jgi:hypothetical protein
MISGFMMRYHLYNLVVGPVVFYTRSYTTYTTIGHGTISTTSRYIISTTEGAREAIDIKVLLKKRKNG